MASLPGDAIAAQVHVIDDLLYAGRLPRGVDNGIALHPALDCSVKNHVSAILKALEVTNRTEAVLAVAALGWELRASER